MWEIDSIGVRNSDENQLNQEEILTMSKLVLQPTREQNILDLVFITAPELVKDLEICQPVGGSDHCSIEFNLKLKFQRPKHWLSLREDFCNLQWDCSYLMESVDDAVERNIPSKQPKPQRNAPWLKADLRKLIRRKRRLWKQAKSSGDPANGPTPKNSGLLSKRAQAIVAWRAASSTRDKEHIHHSIKLTFSTVSSSLFTSRSQKQ
ncbi:hypothetical protein pdam_00000414, partial [Pocillopora damicornis]